MVIPGNQANVLEIVSKHWRVHSTLATRAFCIFEKNVLCKSIQLWVLVCRFFPGKISATPMQEGQQDGKHRSRAWLSCSDKSDREKRYKRKKKHGLPGFKEKSGPFNLRKTRRLVLKQEGFVEEESWKSSRISPNSSPLHIGVHVTIRFYP